MHAHALAYFEILLIFNNSYTCPNITPFLPPRNSVINELVTCKFPVKQSWKIKGICILAKKVIFATLGYWVSVTYLHFV